MKGEREPRRKRLFDKVVRNLGLRPGAGKEVSQSQPRLSKTQDEQPTTAQYGLSEQHSPEGLNQHELIEKMGRAIYRTIREAEVPAYYGPDSYWDDLHNAEDEYDLWKERENERKIQEHGWVSDLTHQEKHGIDRSDLPEPQLSSDFTEPPTEESLRRARESRELLERDKDFDDNRFTPPGAIGRRPRDPR